MSYVLIKNNQVFKYPYSLREFTQDNPNVSLPQNPSQDQLNEVGMYKVDTVLMPVVDYTKNVTEGTPTLINGVWTQTWIVTDATESEIQARETGAKTKNKQQAMQLLTDTDWVEVPSVSDTTRIPHLANFEEFMTYRMALRAIAVTPPVIVSEWPVLPQENWITV